MKSINISEIKNKFGRLLSFASLQCGLREDILNAKIVHNKYFDFLEENETEKFLKDDLENICFNVFGADIRNYQDAFRNDMLYVGECYISISISLSIPLRKMFLLYPIDKMLLLFPTYHEMNPFNIISKVAKDIKNVSSFSMIISESGFSINALSSLLMCDRRILINLRDDPNYENSISHSLLKKLTEILQVDDIFFQKSSFASFYYSLWDDSVFKSIIKKNCQLIVPSAYKLLFPDEALKSSKPYAIISTKDVIIYSSKKERQLPKHLFDYIIKISVEEYKKYCFDNKIAFC